ncbi:MAG: tetratricopeptide repeat protein [Burkholderiaceae bacterium]|nr:tetratricopeptide repeat protein [Burkholderiaceae bacterium]
MPIQRPGLFHALLALALWACAQVALALPAPKDIEAAVRQGQFAQAESMLREVLKEKPLSAKAHYELGQVLAREQRYLEAQQALLQAQKLDPALKFAASPAVFQRVLDAVASETRAPKAPASASSSASSGLGAVAAPAAPVAQAASPSRPVQADAFPWGAVAIGGLVLLGVVWWMRRAATASPLARSMPPVAEPRGFGAAYTPQPAYGGAGSMGQSPGPGNGPLASGGMGSGVAGAVVGGLAGVAAGYALSKVLEGDRSAGASGAAPAAASAADTRSVPLDLAAPPDLGAFDAGSGDSWDAGEAPSGSDDSW